MMKGKKTEHVFVDGIECKPCPRCDQMLPVDNYSQCKATSDGLRSACKECERAENKANYAKNPEHHIARIRAWQAKKPDKVREIDGKRDKKKRNAWRKAWLKANPDKAKEYACRKYLKLKESGYLSAYQRKWREEINRDAHLAIHERARKKRLSTQKGIIDHRMNTALRIALNGGKEHRKWTDIVGYTSSELIEHLGKTMPQGYSWDRLDELHIDHVVPKSLFHYNSTDDGNFKACWSLENLQLLPAKENISKGNKLKILGGYNGF